MKKYFSLFISIFLLFNAKAFSQTTTETGILNLSHKIFKWETSNQIDSLQQAFADKFIVVSSTGESQVKAAYIARLQSGSFVHNKIDVQQDTAIVAGNTAIVIGKGLFNVTISSNTLSLMLSYTEVFSRANEAALWKVLAMHASIIK